MERVFSTIEMIQAYRHKAKELLHSKDFQKDLLIFCGLVVLAILVNLPAYLYVKSDKAMLNVLALDEWEFQNFLESRFFLPLSNGHFKDIVLLQDGWWGYGSLFWHIFGILTFPVHLFGSFPAEIVSLRIISAAWLGVGLFFVYKIIHLLTEKRFHAILGALSILTFPAFYFYTKSFSPEFMASALGVASVYYVLKDRFTLRRSFFIAWFLLGLAIGVKASLIIFFPAFFLSTLLACWNRAVRECVKIFVIAGMVFGIAFIASNPFLLINPREGGNVYVTNLVQNLATNKYGKGLPVDDITPAVWMKEIVQNEFLPLGLFALVLAAFMLSIAENTPHRRNALLFVFGTMGVYLLYIIVSVNKLWSWYLFPAFFLLPIGFYTLQFEHHRWLRRYARFQTPVLLLFLAALFFINVDVTRARYREVAAREMNESFLVKQRSKKEFDQWLAKSPKKNFTILKSPYIYFDPTPYPILAVNPIWGTMRETHFLAYHPDLLLFERNYSFLKDDAEIANWPSYPDILKERELFQTVTGEGLVVDGQRYQYRQILETESFYVYERLMNDEAL